MTCRYKNIFCQINVIITWGLGTKYITNLSTKIHKLVNVVNHGVYTLANIISEFVQLLRSLFVATKKGYVRRYSVSTLF